MENNTSLIYMLRKHNLKIKNDLFRDLTQKLPFQEKIVFIRNFVRHSIVPSIH